MWVRFWGTRGSVPTPGPSTVQYGGNTSCVEVRTAAGTRLVFDSGTGIREMGLAWMGEKQQITAHLFLGHLHWDHINGFPFFTPAFVPGTRLSIYGARDLGRSLREGLEGQMDYTYFPVPLGALLADLQFQELEEQELVVEDARVCAHYLNHTAVCLGYRVDADGVSLAYISDHEPYTLEMAPADEPPGNGLQGGFVHEADWRLIDFVRGADLLVMDTQYTPEEYPTRRGWGHGTTDYVADVAAEAGVKRLALYHHDPTHTDDMLDQMVHNVQERLAQRGSSVCAFAAAEGRTVEL